MTRVPDHTALRLLVAVGVHGSIGAASRVVGMTQQAASERLRATEAQTGLTLVRRGARGSELTSDGTVIAEWAGRLLDLTEELDHAIEGLRGDRGRELTVWASMTVAEGLIPRWLVALRRRQQAEGRVPTTVSLSAANSGQVVRAVVGGTAQLGFVEGPGAPPGVRSRVVARDELVLVTAAGTPLARRRRGLSAEEVSRLALTARETGSGTREVLEQALAAHHLTMAHPEVELTTSTAVREAVLAGSAPAVVSLRLVDREIRDGLLVRVPLTDLPLDRAFRAVWVGTREPPAGPVRDLVAIARATPR